MKTSDLEKFIQSQSNNLYSMAYVLMPDDLQASQLMIDSVQNFLIQKSTLIDKWRSQAENSRACASEDCLIYLLKSMYELSKKRYQQLKMSFKDVEDSSGFFSLDFDEKAALYLKEQAGCELNTIEFIMAKSRNEVLAHLYSARLKMVEGMNTVMAPGPVMQQKGN